MPSLLAVPLTATFDTRPPSPTSSRETSAMAEERAEKKVYQAEERKAFEHVQQTWGPNAERILGKKGLQFVQSHAIRASVHEYTTAMTFLHNMPPLMNGATIGIFPGVKSPVNAAGVLVGRPQIRKSQMTKLTTCLPFSTTY